MDKQKSLTAIEAALQAIEALEPAIKDNNQPKINLELWNARRNLLTLNRMIESRKG